jgi:gamma-glutamylputrescine oxidase
MVTNQQSYAGDGNYARSYYAASANASPKRPELIGSQSIDICILGAGYTGLSTALHLAEKGYKVAIVEGARVGKPRDD